MVASSAGPPSPEFLAETNNPHLDQRVSIAFVVIDTAFLLLFYVSRYYNPKAVGMPMLVCNTLCYVLCMGSAATGICGSCVLLSSLNYSLWDCFYGNGDHVECLCCAVDGERVMFPYAVKRLGTICPLRLHNAVSTLSLHLNHMLKEGKHDH